MLLISLSYVLLSVLTIHMPTMDSVIVIALEVPFRMIKHILATLLVLLASLLIPLLTDVSNTVLQVTSDIQVLLGFVFCRLMVVHFFSLTL